MEPQASQKYFLKSQPSEESRLTSREASMQYCSRNKQTNSSNMAEVHKCRVEAEWPEDMKAQFPTAHITFLSSRFPNPTSPRCKTLKLRNL